MNQTRPLNFQSVMSQGWTAWTLLLLLMIAIMSERGGFAEFAVPPGSVALAIISVVGTVQVLMSVLVRVLDAPWFRWTNAGLAALATLAFSVHHLHSTLGGAPNGICGTSAEGIFHIAETAHHGIGILMCVLGIRWARQGRAASAAFGVRLAQS